MKMFSAIASRVASLLTYPWSRTSTEEVVEKQRPEIDLGRLAQTTGEDLEDIIKLIQEFPDIAEKQDDDGNSLLMLACQQNSVFLVRAIMDLRSKMALVKNQEEVSPIDFVIRRQNRAHLRRAVSYHDVLRLLWPMVPKSYRDEEGRTTLILAIRHELDWEHLICEEIDPNQTDNIGYAAIHHAIIRDCPDIVKRLLELKNLDLTIAPRHSPDKTPSILANELGRTEIVKMLKTYERSTTQES